MKQQRHTPLYVPAYSMGQGDGRAAEFFHGLWRAVVCLSVLVVLLAGVAYADGDPDGDEVEWIDIQDVLDQLTEDQDPEFDLDLVIDPEDPLDPDYGGTADQDPAADPWIDPGYVSDAEYGVQPYSSSTPWYWSSTDISKVTNAMDRLNGGSNASGSLLRLDGLLQSIKQNTANAAIDYSSKIDTIIANTGSNGPIVGHIDFLYDRLGDIYSRLAVTNTKLDTVNDNLTSIDSRLFTVNTRLNSLITLVTGTNSRLDTIYDHDSGRFYHVVNDNPFLISGFDYVLNIYHPSITRFTSNGLYFSVPSYSDVNRFVFVDKSISVSSDWSGVTTPVLIPGNYYELTCSFPCSDYDVNSDIIFSVGGYQIRYSNILSSEANFLFKNVDITVVFTPHRFLSLSSVSFSFSNTFTILDSGVFRCSIVEASSQLVQDFIGSSAVNPGQSGATQQLQQAVDQTEAFEQKMFQDVSTYTKQLNFGLSDWSEAAAGISYIGSVFMLIWDNSPVQPIILSLMLGLCMLLLGRGAKVADAVSRSASDERSSIHQGKGR